VEPDTFGSCIRQCASTIASCRHNEESQGTVHLHVDILQHVAKEASAAADVGVLADDPKLVASRCSGQELAVLKYHSGQEQQALEREPPVRAAYIVPAEQGQSPVAEQPVPVLAVAEIAPR